MWSNDLGASSAYAVLGVAPDASLADIDTAFRSLAKKFHPDTNPGNSEAEQFFKLVTQAYAQIGTQSGRARYDKLHPKGDATNQAEERSTRGVVQRNPNPRSPLFRKYGGWSCVGIGIAMSIWTVLEAVGPTANAAVVITIGLAAAKLLIGGALFLNYPRIEALWKAGQHRTNQYIT